MTADAMIKCCSFDPYQELKEQCSRNEVFRIERFLVSCNFASKQFLLTGWSRDLWRLYHGWVRDHFLQKIVSRHFCLERLLSLTLISMHFVYTFLNLLHIKELYVEPSSLYLVQIPNTIRTFWKVCDCFLVLCFIYSL